MIVYKFGGASVCSAESIKNIARIVSDTSDSLFIVVSAIGKTTNALEIVHSHFMNADKEKALHKLSEIKSNHRLIIKELFDDEKIGIEATEYLFIELEDIITNEIGNSFDKYYDKIVAFGELLSTRIISVFLNEWNISNRWLDIRNLLITDSNHREANVNYNESEKRLSEAIDFHANNIYVSQGFVSANKQGETTTLGREGSDFTAALIGNMLNASRVTIWKDVPGILNADPRIFADTKLIPEMSYQDAVELAFSGAQIIHPKTIRPLENKNIPLFVRSFATPTEKGTVVTTNADPIDVPIYIVRNQQTLITVRPHDFSFILEESLLSFFSTIHKYGLKVSLIQTSAVSISICVDDSRQLHNAIDELCNFFNVSYNEDLELLTIRGTNEENIATHTKGREILLQQRTRRIGRFLMRTSKK